MDLEQIKQHLPHRPPFLWLDSVSELGENKIVAHKHLSPELDVFQGHYPNFPVMPGVLMCEACFQAGALLIAQIEPVRERQVPVVTRVNNVKFRRMVRPGETIDIEVELTERLANAFFMTGKVSVGAQTAARLEFAATATEANA